MIFLQCTLQMCYPMCAQTAAAAAGLVDDFWIAKFKSNKCCEVEKKTP